MSARAARWVLWGTFVLLIPLPFFLVETGVVPAARILMLASVVVALLAAEGAQGTAGILAVVLVVQASVYVALLLWIADRTSRVLARTSPRRIAAATTAVVVVSLLVASSFEIYRTPFRTRSLRADLSQVFE
jgi:glucan phosphoethanolaminetransferase (alkaline phosphatase superfamily)